MPKSACVLSAIADVTSLERPAIAGPLQEPSPWHAGRTSASSHSIPGPRCTSGGRPAGPGTDT
eukprot:9605365-Alexandrium_andersonii.AAC.1